MLYLTAEAWLMLFMLPKCVFPSLKRKCQHSRPTPNEFLCERWSRNKLESLWKQAKENSRSTPTRQDADFKQSLYSAITLARLDMYGKACRMLLSDGIAPHNDTTWELLKAKHPSCTHLSAPAPEPTFPRHHWALSSTLQPSCNLFSDEHKHGVAFYGSACCAAYIASISSSGFADVDNQHLQHAKSTFNGLVSTQDTILIGSIVNSPYLCLSKLTLSSLELSYIPHLLQTSPASSQHQPLRHPLGFQWCLV